MAKKGFLDGYKTYDTSKGFGSVDDWKAAFEKRLNFKVLTEQDKTLNKSIVDSLYKVSNDFFELRKVYRQLMKQYHPDVAGDTEENRIISQLLNDTYFDLKAKF